MGFKIRENLSEKAVLFFYVITSIITITAGDILVELPDGIIRGRQDTSPNKKDFYAFEKIPYAAPPVGKLRFQAPEPPKPWNGVLNATRYDVTCIQLISGDSNYESEDCLYLNVYTPELPAKQNLDSSSDDLLPVMLYIYGGGLFSGDCFMYGPHYLIENDVIVVNFNYRLGPFGFLSTQDKVIYGNSGLKDQLLAIKWVHDNIRLFNGDPDKITIFGESSGAVSVGHHVLNLKSQGLFRAAVAQSGCGISPHGIQRHAREIAFKTAGLIDDSFNTKNDSQELLEFLQSVQAEDLKAAGNKIVASNPLERTQIFHGLFYGPVLEADHTGAFLTEKMYVSLKSGNFLKVPLLIGFTSEEALNLASDMNDLRNMSAAFDQNFSLLVPSDMKITDLDKKSEVGAKIREIYVGSSTFQADLSRTIKFYGDNSRNRPVLKFAELYSKLADVYFYQFSYDGVLGGYSMPEPIDGVGLVSHGEDLRYLFYTNTTAYNNSVLSEYPEQDQIMQHRIQRIWTNFAKTLNPTPEPSELLQNLVWPNANNKNDGPLFYVDLDVNLTIKSNPIGDRYRKWNEIYSSLGYDDFDTY